MGLMPISSATVVKPDPPSQSSGTTRLSGLGNRFVELFGRQLSRQAFAEEMASLITDAVRLKAAVILGYDRRRDRLLLLAEQGLTEAARAALGGGGECTWDIPLRGLRNRRISVIEAAHHNPFVPRPLINMSPSGLCVASLPVYYDFEPTGVVLLFAANARAFPDGVLQTLAQALRVCARGLRDAEGSAARASLRHLDARNAESLDPDAIASASDAREALGAELQLLQAENARQSDALAAAEDLREQVHLLEQQLADAREEVERVTQSRRTLTASANAVSRERDGLLQQLVDAERAREVEGTELRAQIAALEERVLAADSDHARYQRVAAARNSAAQQAVATLEGERTDLLQRVQSAEANAGEAQAALAGVREERDRLTAQVETLSGQLGASQAALARTQARYAEERSTLEGDRGAWQDEAATVRAELTQRTETLQALERDLRAALVARDASGTQLEAARHELNRLATATDELQRTITQLEAARASAAAEGATLRRTLEDERANTQRAATALRTALGDAQAHGERLSSELTALRNELAGRVQQVAERDSQLGLLRQELETSRHGERSWQQASAASRAEVAALSAQVEQGTEERQQLLDERAGLRAALTAARQAASQGDVAHAAALGQLQAEAVELRRQVEALTAERVAWTDRYERAQEEGRSSAHTAAATRQRVDELAELVQQRDAALASAESARQQLTTQLAALTGQLHAGEEAFERAQARYALEHRALEADRDGWKEQAAAARTELAQRTESLAAREYDLQSTIVARDALTVDVQAARADVDRLSALTDELRHALTQAEAARASAAAESAALRRALEDERAGRAETEHVLRANLAALQTQAEQLSATVTLLRGEAAERTRALTERDERLAALRTEIEGLRQHSADRGVLAQQANELGSKVVELEQLLAAARGEAARAERQRDALAERLEAARRRESDITTAASREQATFLQTAERLTAERSRLEAETAARGGEIDRLRASLAQMEETVEALRQQRAAAEAGERDVGRRLQDTQQRLEETSALLGERDVALAQAITERDRRAAEVTALAEEQRAGRDALEAAQARYTQVQAALEADRDTWQQQALSLRNERERLTTVLRDAERRLDELESSRRTALAECTTLHETLETQRLTGRETARTLEADLAAARAEAERLSTEATALREEVAAQAVQIVDLQQLERTAQLAASESGETTAALRAELATLIARLEESSAECEQLRDGRDALERQLALVAATHGEEEQALVHGLQAARDQVAQLEAEHHSLRTALAEARQQLKQAAGAPTVALKEAKAEAADLRKQVKTLTSARAKLTERLERSESARAAHTESAREDSRRATLLEERASQLEADLATAAGRRTELERDLAESRGEVANLATRLDAGVTENEQLRAAHAAAESQLATLLATRDAAQQEAARELQAAREHITRLEEERATAQSTLSVLQERADQAVAALQEARLDADNAHQETQALAAERAALGSRFADGERALAAATDALQEHTHKAVLLAEQSTRLEQSLQAAEARRTHVEAELAQARKEIEALRQQSADRGVLAHQATELGGRVVELEQQLAELRGAVARAERERAALAEELEVALHQYADAAALTETEKTSMRDTLHRLAEERDRLEVEKATQAEQMEAQRATLAETQATLEQVRAERVRAEEDGQNVAQRLGDAHRRLEELSAQLRQRDGALDAIGGERQRLVAQVGKLTGQLRASQETLESTQGRYALERAAIEADRDAWKEKTAAALAELERLTQVTGELHRRAAELEAARAKTTADAAAHRRALDDERAGRTQIEQTLRADMAALQAQAEHLSADTAELRAALRERDQQLEALREERDNARQAETGLQQAAAALRAERDALSERVAENAEECQALRDQRETTGRQLALLVATRGEEAEALTQGLQASRQQIAQLEQERTALRSAMTETRQRLTDAEAAGAAALDHGRAEATALRDQLATLVAARDVLAEQLKGAEQARATYADRVDEEVRRAAALAEQCGQLQQALAAAQVQTGALDAELAQTRAEIEALREKTADRGALARHANELGARAVALEKQLAAARSEGTEAEQQRAALADELEAVRRRHAETERAQAALQESLLRLREEHRGLEMEKAAQGVTLTELQTALEASENERRRVEQHRDNLVQRAADAQRVGAEAVEQLRERDAALTAALGERQRLEGAVRAAEAAADAWSAERDQLRRKIQEAAKPKQDRLNQIDAIGASNEAARLDSERRRSLQADGEATVPTSDADEKPVSPPDGRLVIERSAPLGSVVEDAGEPDASVIEPVQNPVVHQEVATGELVLLDDGPTRDGACTALQSAGFEVATFPATDVGVDEVARRKVKCVMLNLASGVTGWRTLRMLRERVGTRSVPILAYLMKPDTPTGFCFGRADFALWPMEGRRVVERLGALRPKLRRLLVLSADVDGMGQLREALAQASISTSIVLDGKQALEFVTMVEPEAAILHLSPACPSAPRAMLGLRSADLTRDLPLLILIDKAPTSREEAFFTAMGLQLLGKTPFQFSNLPEEIARLIG